MPDPETLNTADVEFSISRVFDAPRPLVWKAWTDPVLLARWFGPKGVTMTVKQFDLRPGGVAHSRMETPDGKVMWAKFVYRDIVEPSVLVWVHSFADEHANLARAPFTDTWPLELLATATFEDQQERTKVSMRWSPINATAEERATFVETMASMHGGWTNSLDQLAELLVEERG